MTPYEMHQAVQQAWEHTQKTAPGPELEEAKRQLTSLRESQRKMAAQTVANPRNSR